MSERRPVRLTPRQKDILRLLDAGQTVDEVAETLGIAKNTVWRQLGLARHWNERSTTYQLMLHAQRDGAFAEEA